LVREQDQARRSYVRRYFNAEIDDPTVYDVTLNPGRLGFARTAEIIAQLALQHRHALPNTNPDGALSHWPQVLYKSRLRRAGAKRHAVIN
jgi:hypothetical protein